MSEDLLPEELRARYHPVALLGEGGFGRVVRAEDTELARTVAIKLLHQVDPEQASRMGREAKIASRLRHAHVLEILDHGVLADGTPYLVTPFIEGEDLHARCSRQAPGRDELRTWVRQIGEALAAAHDVGIVHRDVKPANVLVTEGGDAVLCDFGLARSLDGSTFATQEGLLLGTPEFMAPELWRGKPPGPASDQWAWAAMVQLLRSGQPVYAGRGPGEILDELKRGLRMPPGCPRALARALDPDPSKRYPAMAAAVLAVDAALDEGPPRGTRVANEASPTTHAGGRSMAAAPLTVATTSLPAGPDRRPQVLALALLGCAGLGWVLAPDPDPPAPNSSPPPTTLEEPRPAERDRPPIERLGYPPQLARNLARLENLAGLFSAEHPFPRPRQVHLEPAIATFRLAAPWRDTLTSLPEYFRDPSREEESTLALLGFLDTLALDFRDMSLLADVAHRIQKGYKLDRFLEASHEEAFRELRDLSEETYLLEGDLTTIPSDELALRAILSARFRALEAPVAALDAELLRRLGTTGIDDPWLLLAYGVIPSFNSSDLAPREEKVRALLRELGAAPGRPDLAETCAYLSLLNWLYSTPDRPASALRPPPADLALAGPLIRRCQGRIPNGLPIAVTLVYQLDMLMTTHVGDDDPITAYGPDWWSLPELLMPPGEGKDPLPEWANVLSLTHLQLISRRLRHPDAASIPVTPVLLDRALAVMRKVGELPGPRPPVAEAIIASSADALLELATKSAGDPNLEPALREFATARIPRLPHRYAILQRQIPEALALGGKSELLEATVESIRDLQHEVQRGR